MADSSTRLGWADNGILLRRGGYSRTSTAMYVGLSPARDHLDEPMPDRAKGRETHGYRQHPGVEKNTMYVRVQLLSLDPTRSRAIMRYIDEQLIPRIRQLPGFRRYTVAGDLATGHALTITEWDTAQQAQEQLAVFGMEQESADLGINLEGVYVYETLAQA